MSRRAPRAFATFRLATIYLPHFLLLKWVVVKYNGVPFTKVAGSTPNGAELTLLFVPARIRSRARQKGWGPFSNWYKSSGGGADQVLDLVGAHMCCLVLANGSGRRHERRSSAGVF